MTTNTYALSRTERVWLLFSVTLLVSAAFYGVLAHRVVSVQNRPELTTCLQDFPVLLLISLSIGFFFTVTGLYVCRQTLARKPREEIA
ncbi:hypothetical protein L6Y89_22885 (plasmid) [Enterobacter mori]|uniref:hypothetical protein n=1 Tax=Enterobacter mori TaxID=539813 RepID=UPI001EDC29E8|nr:hypothetical protein [Enterobacter mori]UKJ23726.1 hypothetical protein L6Y89_22885 [Enterobacter mori]